MDVVVSDAVSEMLARRPASVVRASMAALIDAPSVIAPRVGSIQLRPHQIIAAERLCLLIDEHGGALLADPVGLGKTYTALAVARRLGGSLCVAAPAALRDMWARTAKECGLEPHIVSHESLSRGPQRVSAADVFIIDESHRVKSPSTRRYALLAELCSRARVLLVSATPVQNRKDDLAAQLALFVGRRAWQMTEDELARHVVRGRGDDGSMPHQRGPLLVSLECEDDCLDQIVALPSPVPAKDEAVVAALHVYGLVHQWTSSRGALVAALRRRHSRALAMLEALDAGRLPTRAELSAWTHHDDAMQLAFPELVASPLSETQVDASALSLSLDRYLAAVDALLRRCRTTPDPDDQRAASLRMIRDRHPNERIIAFCHYAETVRTLWTRLRRSGGVAALTASGGRVAGGRISRRDAIAQFVPVRRPPNVTDAERIDLLLTTDLLSEGLNLQEGSVIVHLDLPWNPARLDQRVGRVRRLGSRHSTVTVYNLAPPASSERLLRIEERLRDKLRLAQRTIGIAGRILPSPLGAPSERGFSERGLAERLSAVRDRVSSWRRSVESAAPAVAVVVAPMSGFLAVIAEDGSRRLIADVGRGPSEAPEDIELAACCAEGLDAETSSVGWVVDRLERHLVARRANRSIDFSAAAAARHRRATLDRVAQTLARATRHRRAQLASLADVARSVATSELGEGAERVLEMLAKAELPDEAWLRSVATFGELNARSRRTAHGTDRGEGRSARIEALIVFQPDGASVRSGGDET